MKPNSFYLLLLGLLPFFVSAQETPAQLYYIQQYKEIAIREMLRTGIPASITLAQGILESDAGQSELARMANNQFGIKCGNQWQGPTYFKKDDDYGEDGLLMFSCFRAYRDAESSFEDHSSYLKAPGNAGRYGLLFNLGNTDYQSWAVGLQQAGYATSITYPQKLIGLIERYNLNQYDLVFPEREATVSTPMLPSLTLTTNKVPQVFATGFETAGDIAYRTGTPLSQLLAYNEGLIDGYVLPRGEKVFLEPKRKSFKGPLEFHEMAAGETVYDVAQQYGIRLNKLRRRNRLEPYQQPVAGQMLKLSGGKVDETPVYRELKPDDGFDTEEIPEKKKYFIPLNIPVSKDESGAIVSTPQPEYYTVVRSDTLWGIAHRFQTTVEQLKEWNNLSDHIIRRGMILRVR